ncbi:MAG: S1-like domain-containing RNA-binding protein [Prevotellaceae bacterium]|nr:S1-like domain-containing RNA-binding protein [Prevotellaceae bacterium]
MKTTLKLGDYNTLKMTKVAEREDPHAFNGKEVFGIFLDGGEEGEILMPQKYVPEGVKPGDDVRCFLYLDQDERLIATTETPKAKVGDFAYLKVNWVNKFGAFLDWGVLKDVFCPFREMKKKMEIGEYYIVYIHIDEDSYRIMASAKVEHFLSEEKPTYKPGTEVDLLVWQKTDLGFKVIVDNKYAGLLYDDQIFQPLHTGDRVKGYISTVRPDGKIDVALQATGRRQTKNFADELLQYLKEHDGRCDLGDKSAADDIYERFHVSKKVFKRAVGDLYKQRLITVSPLSIALVGA